LNRRDRGIREGVSVPNLYFLSDDVIERHALLDGGPTRIDASGAIASDGSFVASIVPFSTTPMRFALVANGDAVVAVGAQPVCGAVELADGDRVFVGGREFLTSFDTLPLPVGAPRGARCPVCDRASETASPDAGALLLACPRCGARACAGCWRGFRGGVCLTPHCGHPAALERPLWSPDHSDFIDFMADDRVAPAEI
jgi:hypothetical protein